MAFISRFQEEPTKSVFNGVRRIRLEMDDGTEVVLRATDVQVVPHLDHRENVYNVRINGEVSLLELVEDKLREEPSKPEDVNGSLKRQVEEFELR